jgi:hypothetical protein
MLSVEDQHNLERARCETNGEILALAGSINMNSVARHIKVNDKLSRNGSRKSDTRQWFASDNCSLARSDTETAATAPECGIDGTVTGARHPEHPLGTEYPVEVPTNCL